MPHHQIATVAELDELFALESELAKLGSPPPLEVDPRFARVRMFESEPKDLGSHYRLGVRVVKSKGHIEVAAVEGRPTVDDRPTHYRPPQPGAPRQPPDRSGHECDEAREMHHQALFEVTA